MVVVSALLAFAASCGGGESSPEQANEAAPTTVVSSDGGDALPTSAATASPTVGSEPAAQPTASVPAFVGEWPNRFCVSGVDSTLNLRAAPSTDAEILASIPPSSCNIVSGGTGLDYNFQPVIYTTVDGAIDGWVSNNFISFQDPPERIERDGTVIANLSVGPLQRGTNGYDGEPYFEPDFPDGPTITSFSVLQD